jgi:hypothetical protein
MVQPVMRSLADGSEAAMIEDALKTDNDYLKARNAQLQDDVTHLQAEVVRLRNQLERFVAPRPPA